MDLRREESAMTTNVHLQVRELDRHAKPVMGNPF